MQSAGLSGVQRQTSPFSNWPGRGQRIKPQHYATDPAAAQSGVTCGTDKAYTHTYFCSPQICPPKSCCNGFRAIGNIALIGARIRLPSARARCRDLTWGRFPKQENGRVWKFRRLVLDSTSDEPITGISFDQSGGEVYWDKAGLQRNPQNPGAEPLGDVVWALAVSPEFQFIR